MVFYLRIEGLKRDFRQTYNAELEGGAYFDIVGGN
jgi:hypothetical protein